MLARHTFLIKNENKFTVSYNQNMSECFYTFPALDPSLNLNKKNQECNH